jgi:translation initiation factor 2 subunit 3
MSHPAAKTIHAEKEPSKAKAIDRAAHTRMHATEKEGRVKQPVVNVGLVGHVDHGKCIALDESILLNNDLTDGDSILAEKCADREPLLVSDSERLFGVPGLRAFCLDSAFQFVSAPARVFVQNYHGTMIEMVTQDGKRLKASPEHPLLVHDGKTTAWKKMEDLQKGDFVGALRKIPESPAVKDPFPQWKQNMQKEFWVVSRERAAELEKKSGGFKRFEALTVGELNEIRILKRLSFTDLRRACHSGHWSFSSGFKRNRLTIRQLRELSTFFANTPTEIPRGTILNIKAKSHCFAEIQKTGFDDDTLRFLAFIIGEGHLEQHNIRIAQAKNVLLSGFLGFCEQNFGLPAKYRGHYDYCLNSKTIVSFLRARYGIRVGTARQTGIPAWVFSLPNAKLAVFLRTFFSAEGNVNIKSGQIALTQANKKSILLLGYALKKFGIVNSIHPIWKKATNSTSPKREYWQLLISDLASIRRFKEAIGFDLAEKQAKLYLLLARTPRGKTSNHMIPVDYKVLSELVGLLGLKKKNFSVNGKALKKQPWFFAYQDCRYKNAVNREKLEQIIGFLRKRQQTVPEDISEIPSKEFLSEWGISQGDLQQNSGLSSKQVNRAINDITKQNIAVHTAALAGAVRKILQVRSRAAKSMLDTLVEASPDNVEWCKIAEVRKTRHHGPIIDLQVPGYHNFICGTGGLISHNTSLTQALTEKWTDTHSEEIKRGISIRLGYADAIFYECPNCNGAERFSNKPVCPQCQSPTKELRRVSFVDAPGHETLLTTTLSGAAVMDGAILVIAANEPCPQPSTIEHLMALKIVGISHIIVVQNKVDLVSKEEALKNHSQILAFLKENGFENTVIIPTAAHFRLNIDLLIEAIEKEIPTPVKDPSLPLRLFVVRSFDINKPGCLPEELKGGVVGGSIAQGSVEQGSTIVISPGFEKGPVETKVTSIHTTFGPVQKAFPGGLIALGTLLDPNQTKNDQLKGQLVGQQGELPQPTTTVHLKLFPFKRLIESASSELRATETVVLTIGTSTAVGVVSKAKKDEAVIVLKNPVILEKQQKVVISRHQKSGWRLAAYGVCS